MTHNLNKVNPKHVEFDQNIYDLYWHFDRSLTKVKNYLRDALKDDSLKCQLQTICGCLPWWNADIKDTLISLGENYTILPEDWAPNRETSLCPHCSQRYVGSIPVTCPHCGGPYHKQLMRRRPRVGGT